ncbi:MULTISPECIES: hypothetical protein [unclassified Roseovarius]|uniref:hypothetical protein n=1 Tax=unclassified Roseovarius TaxID=2614913 RepID=UPI00273E7D46|nr:MULTISPECIES: hypothetical protein [unclassified Roseovarius]
MKKDLGMANLIDKIALWRRGIFKEVSFGNRRTIFQTKDSLNPIALKFSYAGNVQYHLLSDSDVEQLANKLNTFLEQGKIS